MSKRNRSAATGRFVSPEDAAADPERHVAETVEQRPAVDLRVERMSGAMTKLHLGTPDRPRVVHRFTAPDGGDPHDHAQFGFWSTVIDGSYVEERYQRDGSCGRIHRRQGDRFYVEPGAIHRIVELPDGECWTMIEPDPHTGRDSGFYQFRADGVWHRLWHQDEWRRIDQND